MENQEKHFVKTSSEAIKSLVSKGVPGYTKKKKTKKKPQNKKKIVFEGLDEYTQITFVEDSREGF